MSRTRWSLLLLLALPPIAGTQAVAAEPPGQALADLLVATDGAPFRLRLRVQIDGEDAAARFERVQAEYVRRLFAQLDRDADGSLTPGEAAHAPSPDIVLPAEALSAESENVNVAFNFRAVDENGDGTATPAELLEFYQYFGGEPLQVRPAGRRRVDHPQLHSALLARLDANSDGAVSLEELEQVTKLAALDQNGDEILTPAELLGSVPNEANVAQPGATGAARRPLEVRAPASERPDCEVIIRFAGEAPLPQIVVQPQPGGVIHREPDVPSLVMSSGGTACQIQAACGPLRVLDRMRQALVLEFDGADEDGDGRVTADQRLPELLGQRFPLLDANGDGAVSRAELDAYARDVLHHEATLRRSQFHVAVDAAGSGVFDVLDENRDGRLSLRELQTAQARYEGLDKNGDGRLEMAELVTAVRLVIRRGDLPPPYGIGGDNGPPWFARMDRNLDGDVSAREFLGVPGLFEQFDADGDGFIDLGEALQADSQFQRTDPAD